jgi:hypothetical protein
MPSKVVHVGLHKTGTTSLQDSYFPFVAKVNSYEYNPPEIMNAIDKGYRKGFASCAKQKEQIREYLNLNKRVIVSDEGLLGNPLDNYSAFDRSVEFLLDSFGNDAVIIVVLRNQPDFIESLYRHVVKRYESIGFESFVNFEKGRWGGRKDVCDNNKPRNISVKFSFHSMINKLKENFPDVRVFYYEQLVQSPDLYFQAWSHVLDWEGKFDYLRPKKSNISVGYSQVMLVRCVGQALLWNSFNYPWKKGNLFGKMTRIVFNKISPVLFYAIEVLSSSNNKKFIDKYRNSILSVNENNTELGVPEELKRHYLYNSDENSLND